MSATQRTHREPGQTPLRRLGSALAWALATVCVGLVCGAAAVLLSLACSLTEDASQTCPPLFLCLPACALLTCLLYHALGVSNDITTASVFSRQRDGGPLPAQLAPAILAGTALTLLGGGSVGKEAAALQLGGALGAQVECLGRRRRRKGARENDGGILTELSGARETFVLAGMAAAFAALLFAPVAATLLVLEVARPARERLLCWRTLCIPGAAAVSFALASLFGVGRLWSAWTQPDPTQLACVTAEGLAALVIGTFGVGVAFVWLLKTLRSLVRRLLPRVWVRTLVGACMAVALAFLLGHALAGTGATQIMQALGGDAVAADVFVRKALLTLACLGFGLKGGEVMPALSIGACLGCSVAALVGADPTLFAALGLVAMFSTCSLSPLTACALGVEAFGVAFAPLVAVAALVPGLAATALDMARLCRTRSDVRLYVQDASMLAGQRGAFSLGLFVR